MCIFIFVICKRERKRAAGILLKRRSGPFRGQKNDNSNKDKKKRQKNVKKMFSVKTSGNTHTDVPLNVNGQYVLDNKNTSQSKVGEASDKVNDSKRERVTASSI